MNQHINLTYFFILALCLSLTAFGAIVAHMIWSDKYKRDLQETRNMTQRECWAAQKSQETMQGEQGKLFLEAMEQQNEIALFLRNNYQREIKLGYHGGRGLANIVTGYLAVEREHKDCFPIPPLLTRESLSRERSENATATTERIKTGAQLFTPDRRAGDPGYVDVKESANG